MSTDSIDLRQLNPETLDAAINEWRKLDSLVDPRQRDLMGKYQTLRTNAVSQYERLKLNLGVPGGLSNIDSQITKLNEMFEEALAIRGKMAVNQMRGDLRIAPGTSFETAIDTEMDTAFKGIGDGKRATIETKLLPMLYGLGIDPADVRAGETNDNFYFFPNSGAVNFDRVTDAKKMVEELRSAATVTPGLARIADLLETGVRRIEQINPVGAAVYAFNQEQAQARGMNTKPLRIVGAVGAGLITLFGLGQHIVQTMRAKEGQGPEFNPLILGWAFATMAIVNPKIVMQSGTSKVLENITELGQAPNRKVISAGFTDPKALEELQELAADDPKGMRELSKLETLTVAQVEALTESKTSPLTKTLLELPENLRPMALRQFGLKQLDEEEAEITKTFMSTPGLARGTI